MFARLLLLATVAAGLWFGLRAAPPVTAKDFARGVTVSCQTSGFEWGRPEMAQTMDDLKSLGVTWISMHPYARIGADGSVRWREDLAPANLVRPLAWAKERGLGVMIVPHLAYWGSPFKWRGDIDFTSDAEWDRFFADYEKWIVAQATIAEAGGAGRFCLGLEYSHAQKFEARWRQIIAAVRAVYHGRLSYGANWNEVATVPFWDALDEIGVLAYFPLTTATAPGDAELAAGWKPWLKQLAGLSGKYGKPILFTEVGYDCSEACAARPWEDGRARTPAAAELQARCLDIALRVPERAPWLAGMFLWKWFPDMPSHHHHGETFDLRTPALRRVIGERWAPRTTPN